MPPTDRATKATGSERRPYFAWSTAQLEEVAEERWGDAEGLCVVMRELRHRKRPKALRLRARVDARLGELRSREVPAVPAWQARSVGAPGGTPRDDRSFDPADVSVGVLAASGYRVGRNGVCTEARRRALERIVEREITDVDDPAYLASWGRPGSAERLRRTAYVLAKLARGARTRGASMTSARVAWSRDLAYLKERYYDGRHEHAFAWPSDRF